jgi:ABC-type multidrug transport system fused ATPase/permease subunit
MGISTLFGVGILIILYPLNVIASKLYSKEETNLIKAKDKRTKLVNEMLQGMKIVKFFAWEKKFKELIKELRNEEKICLQKIAVYESIQNTVSKTYSYIKVDKVLFNCVKYINIDRIWINRRRVGHAQSIHCFIFVYFD